MQAGKVGQSRPQLKRDAPGFFPAWKLATCYHMERMEKSYEILEKN
jgi:hypothetical protein